ncbi:MAG: DNA-binding response regulator, partial [SAR202 cluster bacterium]|nr:DNA-binding response regulator [SAR202 cluster bacterium]
RIYRREEILHHVWGTDYIGGLRTVDVHIRRLRSNLGREGERWLRTVRNVGYGLDRDD